MPYSFLYLSIFSTYITRYIVCKNIKSLHLKIVIFSTWKFAVLHSVLTQDLNNKSK